MKADEYALSIMRERAREGTRWAAYLNTALDSELMGHLQFLHVGEGCTYETPPSKYPIDNEYGLGWRYQLVGFVNLETGEVE